MSLLCTAQALGVTYSTASGPLRALEDVHLELMSGEIV